MKVAKEVQNKGLGSFVLTNTIQLAHSEGCDAVFFTGECQQIFILSDINQNLAAGGAAKRVAEKLNIGPQFKISIQQEDSIFDKLAEDLNCYLVLFKQLE